MHFPFLTLALLALAAAPWAQAEPPGAPCNIKVSGVDNPQDLNDALAFIRQSVTPVAEKLGFNGCPVFYARQPSGFEQVEFIKAGDKLENWRDMLTFTVNPADDVTVFVPAYRKAVEATGGSFTMLDEGTTGQDNQPFHYFAYRMSSDRPVGNAPAGTEYGVALAVSTGGNVFTFIRQQRYPLTEADRNSFIETMKQVVPPRQ